MTEETGQDKAEETPPEETPPEEEATVTGQDPERVEFTPEQQKRFNQLYAALKQQEKLTGELAKDHKALLGRLEKEEAAREEARRQGALTDLKEQKVKALSEADFEKVAEIDEKIIAASQKPVRDEKPKEESAEFFFTPSQQDKLISWASESGADGQPLRPWADPGHPEHQRFVREADAVLAHAKYRGKPLDEVLDAVLQETERRMTPPKAGRAAVLSGNGNARPQDKGKVELTPDQKLIARKMGMSPDQYAKAMQRWT